MGLPRLVNYLKRPTNRKVLPVLTDSGELSGLHKTERERRHESLWT